MPPNSSPPPARPGPPCTSIGKGEPWPVEDFALSRLPIITRPVERGKAQHDLFGDLWRIGEQRRHQRAFAKCGDLHRLRRVVIGQQCGDRTEGFDLVHGLRAQEIIRIK